MQWILVLGCRVERSGSALRGTLSRRVEHAAKVFRELDQAGEAAQVVATGGIRWEGELECDAMRDALIGLGVPSSRILTEPHARNTRENANYTAALLQPYLANGDRLLLVTSDWHLPRADMLFREAGLPATPHCPQEPADMMALPRRLFWRAREGVAMVKDRILVEAKRVSSARRNPR
ncbi:MAG: YdcF family protein [Polyangiaceae bacterium]